MDAGCGEEDEGMWEICVMRGAAIEEEVNDCFGLGVGLVQCMWFRCENVCLVSSIFHLA